jgi:CTP-dependent riboflavin kinase
LIASDVASFARMTGAIFSDLGQASRFMALDWVQELFRQCLGYHPFPATLNLRPVTPDDSQVWQRVQRELVGVALPPAAGGHCAAKLFRVEIQASESAARITGAVVLPEVKDYPSDKIEVVAPLRLKDHLGVKDGDRLILEFFR